MTAEQPQESFADAVLDYRKRLEELPTLRSADGLVLEWTGKEWAWLRPEEGAA